MATRSFWKSCQTKLVVGKSIKWGFKPQRLPYLGRLWKHINRSLGECVHVPLAILCDSLFTLDSLRSKLEEPTCIRKNLPTFQGAQNFGELGSLTFGACEARLVEGSKDIWSVNYLGT